MASKAETQTGKPAAPCAMVILGAGGDLAKRKLFPALYNLAKDKLLPKEFAVVAFGRSLGTTEEFRKRLLEELPGFVSPSGEPQLIQWLVERTHVQFGAFEAADAFGELKARLGKLDREQGTKGNHLYYLATAPEYFAGIVEQLGAVGLHKETEGHWRRVVIEKPFGHDLESARILNRKLAGILHESQIYRIDHYLGKETVQNILALRFGNGIFEPVWNRRYIDHVQITVAETVGVETRGGYYDESGALRDMVPNHIFQLISLMALEPPGSFEADAVRHEQTKVIRAIHPLSERDVASHSVRGQYGGGRSEGAEAPAYRAEPRVSSKSNTETFAALKLQIDNWRWADVPFYLRTGKRLPKRVTEAVIQFKSVPHMLFHKTAVDRLEPNQLMLHIQPKEGISLQFGAKVPGPILKLGSVDMEFRYEDYFCCQASTGYERLLYECMIGDATLFQRADMVEASWEVVQPIQDFWASHTPRDFPNYDAGTWGPKESEELLHNDGRSWRNA